MTSPTLLAGLAAAAASGVGLLYRVYARRDGDLGTLLLCQSLPTGLVMALWLQPEGVGALSGGAAAGLLLSGALWVLMARWDVEAYAHLGAGLSGILNVARFAALSAVGVLAFGERLSAAQLLGCALVVMGVIGSVGALGEVSRRGRGGVMLEELRRSWGLIGATCALYALCGWALIHALAEGALWSSVVVYEARVVLTLALGVALLGERERALRRGVAAAVCVAGVWLATL